MPERNDDRIAPMTAESAATGGHHVRQVLVASLIGAIVVMIAIATLTLHVDNRPAAYWRAAGSEQSRIENSEDMKEVLRHNTETLEREITRQVPGLHSPSRTPGRCSEKTDAMASAR